MSISVEEGDEVTFQLVTSGILDTSFSNVKVLGTLAYDGARLIDPELASKHYSLYSYFKDAVGNVDNPAAYKYLVVQLSNGAAQVVGIPWIMESSFTVVGDQVGTIIITGYQQKFTAPLQDLLGNRGAKDTLTVK